MHPLIGKWTYRSFRSNYEPVGDDPDKLLALLFGEGELVIEKVDKELLTGSLSFGSDYLMKLDGTLSAGGSDIDPSFTCWITGKGVNGTLAEGWIYDYIGYLIPSWSNGVNQRPAIVGSVIRTVAHSGGAAQAGYVACFIAVKHD